MDSMVLETMDLRQDVRIGQSHNPTHAYLDSLGIKLKSALVGEELLYIFALIALKLDHLAHLTVDDNGAIASYSRY